jgi:hypothetical protein
VIYLSGAVRPEFAGRGDTGYMLTPMMGNRPDLSETFWGADNGCFSQPEKFTLDGYYAWLASHAVDRPTCLFAVAPDVVGNAYKTLERSRPVMPVIRALGYPVAFVAQDGIQAITIPWDEFDCLFVGGSTQFKLSEQAYAVAAEARRRGKWTHMGRVNSLRRLQAAAQGGYDSADGTYAAFGPDINVPKVFSWLRQLNRQPSLWETP